MKKNSRSALFIYLIIASKALELSASIVPPSDQIEDFDAKKALAQALSESLDTLPEAIKQFEILMKEHPNDPHLFLDREKALLHLEDLKRESSAKISLVPRQEWINDNQTRFTLATIYSYHRHTYSDALALFRYLLAEEPHNPLLLLNIAEILTSDFHFSEAIAILDF